MQSKINSYLAVLIITIAGSWAALFIIRVATSDTLTALFADNAENYAALQQSKARR